VGGGGGAFDQTELTVNLQSCLLGDHLSE
jgi:hypothetical protein